MCVDILIVEIAGSGVMKITVYSVTSYAFRKDFFWGGGGVRESCECEIGGLFLHL